MKFGTWHGNEGTHQLFGTELQNKKNKKQKQRGVETHVQSVITLQEEKSSMQNQQTIATMRSERLQKGSNSNQKGKHTNIGCHQKGHKVSVDVSNQTKAKSGQHCYTHTGV